MNTKATLSGDLDWMTSGEVAEYLGVAIPSVYAFVDRGELIGFRIGRSIRCQRADVEAFIASCRILPGAMLEDVGAARQSYAVIVDDRPGPP